MPKHFGNSARRNKPSFFSAMSQPPSRIDDYFTDRPAEQDLQTIENVASQDAFAADKVRLQPARIILPVKLDPDMKCQRGRCTSCDTAD